MNKRNNSLLSVELTVDIPNKEKLSEVYTPGVADVVQEVNRENKGDYLLNPIAVISDGSAVLGFGKLNTVKALPILEAKAALYKRFSNSTAIPLVIDADSTAMLEKIVRSIAINFSAIHLEDIASPHCFELTNRLSDLNIPVVHDDKSCTSIVILAALINLCQLWESELKELKLCICGIGAAGIGLIELLDHCGIKNIKAVDKNGLIVEGERGYFPQWDKIAKRYNPSGKRESLAEAMQDSDVFIGLSAPGIVTEEMVSKMASRRAVMALANPVSEIPYDKAINVADVVCTGSTKYPNAVNNALVFPHYIPMLLDRKEQNTFENQYVFARKLAALTKGVSAKKLIPSVFDIKKGFWK
jgi:malate dehydrogenase (oxaloacetate-decarboxylating)